MKLDSSFSAHRPPRALAVVPALLLTGAAALAVAHTSPPRSGVAGDASPSALAGEDDGRQQFDIKEDPGFVAGLPLRPMDREVFRALADRTLSRNQLADLAPERPYRVRVVGSVAEHRFGAVLIDANRDGTFDERWALAGDEVTRDVRADPAAGGAKVRYTLAHGRWQPR